MNSSVASAARTTAGAPAGPRVRAAGGAAAPGLPFELLLDQADGGRTEAAEVPDSCSAQLADRSGAPEGWPVRTGQARLRSKRSLADDVNDATPPRASDRQSTPDDSTNVAATIATVPAPVDFACLGMLSARARPAPAADASAQAIPTPPLPAPESTGQERMSAARGDDGPSSGPTSSESGAAPAATPLPVATQPESDAPTSSLPHPRANGEVPPRGRVSAALGFAVDRNTARADDGPDTTLASALAASTGHTAMQASAAPPAPQASAAPPAPQGENAQTGADALPPAVPPPSAQAAARTQAALRAMASLSVGSAGEVERNQPLGAATSDRTATGSPPARVGALLHAALDAPVRLPAARPLPAADTTTNVEDAGLERQIVQAVRLQWRDGAGSARVALDPAFLGSVSITLHVERGAVTASIRAENPDVRAWLAANQPSLRDALARHGLSLDQLHISDEASPDAEDDDGRRQEPREQPVPPQPKRSTSTFEIVI